MFSKNPRTVRLGPFMVRFCLMDYRSFGLGNKRDDDVGSTAATQTCFGSHALPTCGT
jgi:hypothetical protein